MGFRFSYIALEAYRGFRRNLLLAGSMVVIVAISLTLLGVALLAGRQVNLYGGFWGDKVEVSVFLEDGITDAQRADVQAKLKGVGAVQNVLYESKDQAYERFKEQFKDSPDLVNNVDRKAMPESFRVKLRNPERFADVHDVFCHKSTKDAKGELCTDGVDVVIDQRALVERFFSVLNALKVAFLVLAGVLGAAAVILIAVTVRVAAFARRKETQVMKLVGASNTYIRLPFLAEGVFAGLLGAVVAFLFLRGGMFWVDRLRGQRNLFSQMPLIGMSDFWPTWLLLLLLGTVISGLASMLALRKYVRV